jgi:hypothetical protein
MALDPVGSAWHRPATVNAAVDESVGLPCRVGHLELALTSWVCSKKGEKPSQTCCRSC